MSEPTVRRFSRFAIVFHWVVGLPYMALLASGGLILLQRTDLLHWRAAKMVELLHLWIGIGLCIVIVQGTFAAVVTGRLSGIRSDVAEWIRLRPRDILWLLKVPLNIFWPRRFTLPPVGRYNAGQKLHGLFIFVALIAFMLTGVLMIVRPADLRPWIIHSWLWYAAAGFLALHLFLGLINRATRPALSGIFTGEVPREYVEHHHPLVLEKPVAPSEHAVVSWRALAGTWAGALLVAAGVLRWYGPERAAQQVLRIQGQEHASISPGPLFAAHADDPRVASCQTCHQSLQQPPDGACLACHSEIQTVMEGKLGFHGQLEGSCRQCHSEHKGRDASLIEFDPNTFNHDLARFKLVGEHREIRCDECHVPHSPKPGQRRFIDTTHACAGCHADPHEPSVGDDCQRCHSAQGWKSPNLLFVHDRDSSFKIDAIHADVACASCHVSGSGATHYRLEARTCESCHTAIAQAMAGTIDGTRGATDPHAGHTQCADCHLTDVHSMTPALYADRCQKCHTPRYRGLLFDWQRTLDERVQSAGAAIAELHPFDTEKSKLTRQLDLASQVGIHNVERAVAIMSQIQAAAHATGGPSTAPAKDPANPLRAR